MNSGDRCISPLRPESNNKTSFVVNDDFFFDFGNGQGGDVIDFCALYAHGGDRGEAIRELSDLTGLQTESQEHWKDYTQNLCNKIAKWHSQLTDEDYAYLHKRRISDAVIKGLMLGRTDDGRLCIPYFKNGYVAYYTTRAMPGGAEPDKKYKKQKIDRYNENIVWGMDSLKRDKKLLVIAEGAFDVMSFYQEGYACISAMTGVFSSKQIKTVIAAAKSFERVFLVYDNDVKSGAGEKFTKKMANIFLANNIPFIVGKVPKGSKDVSEYYEAGGDLKFLIDTAISGYEYIVSEFKADEEFEKFIRDKSRFMKKTDVQKLFTFAEDRLHLDKNYAKVLKKECTSCPLETTILQAVIKKHDLLYNPKIGFYEYNGKYWKQIADEIVKKYIADELGYYKSGTKCNSILHLVKSACVTEEVFNVKPLLNFINGCLEIQPEIVFRAHNKNDLVTYCLDYPYLPNAKCERWEQFVGEVTDDDDKKIVLLQELSGYVLYPNNNELQKCACFIGNGANGKSVFLNILTKVFGETNVSNVEMSSLTKDFNAIHLMGSMINISAETKSNVNGAESLFKQIVVGDEITDSYKGKDKIKFRPRAKMFIACNEFVESKDTTDGWLRRFCFVDFPIKFCDNPTGKKEKKIDKQIEEKLTLEISGIFNWVLEGYKILRAAGEFIMPEDHNMIMENYKEVINPLIVFVKGVEVTNSINNNALYQEYIDWTERNHNKALSKINFSRKIKPLIAEYRQELEEYRTSSERGYRVKR